jgi:ABC-type branched-subunit amino acid transport system substrate-binding protein
MIPFYLEDIGKIDVENHSTGSKVNNLYRSFTFVQFYEGFLMALDSLKKLGLSVKLFVYDVDEDTVLMQKIIKKPEMEKMDLIIGPFFTKNLSTIAKFAKKNHISIIDPVTADGEILNGNPNIYKATPSMATQLGEVAEYIIANHFDKNIIIVHNNKENEKPILNTFKTEFDAHLKAKGELKELKECVFNVSGVGGLTKLMSKSNENVIITLSSGEVFVTNYVNKLNDLIKDYKITLFGLPSWRSFENIEIEYFQNLNLHLFSSSFIDYTNPRVNNFILAYREKYKTEPDKFAFIGYDVASYFLNVLSKYGNNFEDCISQYPYEGIQTNFVYKKSVDNSRGRENTYVNIYKFQDFNLINVKSKK